jgi:signal transduction histidine kinase
MNRRHGLLLYAFAALILSAGATSWLIRAWMHNPQRGLPCNLTLQTGNLDNWRPFGGTWIVKRGTIRNDSDERGAKIVTGSPYWKNYSVQADIQLLGSEGDAGLIIRSSQEQTGVDAYKGYYAGLRGRESQISTDESLILGKADYQYTELRQERLPPGVVPFRWYHLKLLVYGCHLVASVTWPLHSSNTYTVSASDPGCYTRGRIGLRSYASGGVWKNIRILPATKADMQKMLAVHPPLGPFPDRLPRQPTKAAPPAPDLTSVRQLRLMAPHSKQYATIRGVVIATIPQLYIEDATGGAAVDTVQHVHLKIGDEVQASGLVSPGAFSPSLRDARVQVLWASTPNPPVFATPSQAASGTFAAMFIEVSGVLQGKSLGPDHSLILHLRKGQQTFQALLYGEQAASLYDSLKPGSLIAVRGVCVVTPNYTRNITPFALLLRSGGDLLVLTGPPWWSPRHLIELTALIFAFLLFIQYLHLRMEQWRLRAVLDERGRLAHEMHDTLAQSFAGIGFQLEALRDELPDHGRARTHLEIARGLVRYSHEEARRNIASLRPENLASLGLVEALKRFAESKLSAGDVQVIAEGNEAALSLPPAFADTLLRIGQEAVANSIRHARPSIISIRLRVLGGAVTFSIHDNGAGFEPGAAATGFGLGGMRKRAEMISAQLILSSAPSEGTTVTVHAKLPSTLSWGTLHLHVWEYLKKFVLRGSRHAY